MTEVAPEQRAIVAFLERVWPGAERIDTHISHVFLTGERAYKLKRAVKLSYLDFSTRALRRRFAAAEVALNRRTAPELYLGVMPVKPGPALGALNEEDDAALDWLVVMRRFGQDTLLDSLARAGKLTPEIVAELAEQIAAFHAKAEPAYGYGGHDAMEAITLGNLAELRARTPNVFAADKVSALDKAWGAALERVGDLLDRRRIEGKVRHCHGDLHLRNICLLDGKPTLFDALEFSTALASIDVLYDFAFLLMDLAHRDLRGLANLALNAYLSATGDYGGLAALPLFESLRAGVRAHVGDDPSYLDLGLASMAPARPRLIAVGGLSGTGKSTVAQAIAPSLAAVVLRSDVVRKRLAGVHPLTRLPPDAYGEQQSVAVYERLSADARTVLAAGRSAIVDAVYAKPEQRDALARLAREAGVPFVGIWLDAAPQIRVRRIGARARDASDATPDLVAQQDRYDLGPIDWLRIDAGAGLATTVQRARAALADQLD